MPGRRPAVVAVSGVKNSGKTSLIAGMLPHLAAAGLRVAVIKHDGHSFQPDPPGTDTGRCMAAGAPGTAIFDGEKYKIVKREQVDENTLIARFPEADLILLEGFKHSAWPKIELVRAGNSDAPVCDPDTLLALVTDLPVPRLNVPRIAFGDAAGAAAVIIAHAARAVGLPGKEGRKPQSSDEERPQAKMFTERPFTLTANGRHIATFMCTPQHLEELAVGHLAATGRIARADDMEHCRIKDGRIEVRLRRDPVPPGYAVAFDGQGLPEPASLPRYAGDRERPPVAMQRMERAAEEMIASAVLYPQTGGVHCAAFGSTAGLIVREDVGRNNAMDKVIGAALLRGLDRSEGFLLVTARVAFEMLLKAAGAGVPILGSLNIPSDLAVAAAQSAGITLAGKILKREQHVYTHPQRIKK